MPFLINKSSWRSHYDPSEYAGSLPTVLDCDNDPHLTDTDGMDGDIAALQYAWILRRLKDDMALNLPPAKSRPHCHCPKCGRIIEEEEEEVEEVEADDCSEEEEDSSEDDEGDGGSVEGKESDDEDGSDAHYLNILSDIRILIQDPFEGNSADKLRLRSEIFDPDLIKRHSMFGGGRRKNRARTKSLRDTRSITRRIDHSAKHRRRNLREATINVLLEKDHVSVPPLSLSSKHESHATAVVEKSELINVVHSAEDDAPEQFPTLELRTTSDEHNSRPKQRKNSTAKIAVIAKLPKNELEEKASAPTCQPIVIIVDHPHLELFLRMFGDPTINAINGARTMFNDIVAAMSNAGFIIEQSGRCARSAVAFKDINHLYNGRTITFHRPHPDPRIPQHMLRKWGKRLSDAFGWSLGSFVQRTAAQDRSMSPA